MNIYEYFAAVEKYTTPKEWLDYFYYFFGKFNIQKQSVKNGENFFSKWVFYDGKNYVAQNARQIMPIEIIFDIDCNKDKERAHIKTEELKKKLIKFNYAVFDSGGSGFHISLYFPELIKFNTEEIEEIKREFIKYVDKDYGYSDFSSVYEKRLIALECSNHRKTGKPKHWIFSNKGKDVNKLPEVVISNAMNVIKKNDSFVFVDELQEKTSFKDMDCLTFIESGKIRQLKDFMRRASFIYGATLIRKHSPEYITKRLMVYTGLKEPELKGIVKYLKKDRFITCRGRKKYLSDCGFGYLCLKCKMNKTKCKDGEKNG